MWIKNFLAVLFCSTLVMGTNYLPVVDLERQDRNILAAYRDCIEKILLIVASNSMLARNPGPTYEIIRDHPFMFVAVPLAALLCFLVLVEVQFLGARPRRSPRAIAIAPLLYATIANLYAGSLGVMVSIFEQNDLLEPLITSAFLHTMFKMIAIYMLMQGHWALSLLALLILSTDL